MKATKIIALGALTIMALGATSCRLEKVRPYDPEHSKMMEKSMTVNPYTRIETHGSVDIEYIQGPARISYKVPQGYQKYVNIKVENGCMVIDFMRNMPSNGATLEVECYSPDLESIQLNGAGEIEGKQATLKDLKIEINGAGTLDWKDLQANNVEIGLNGSGEIDLQHYRGGNLSLSSSGAGDIDIEDVNAGIITAQLSGAATFEISGKCQKARFNASGAAEIERPRLFCSDIKEIKNGKETNK